MQDRDNQENPDIQTLDINVKEVVELLAQEEGVLGTRRRAEELEKDNSELGSTLAKREAELDRKNQEKEDLESSLARTKEKLETEVLCHNETKQRLSAAETRALVSSANIVSDPKLVSPGPVHPPPPSPPVAPPPPLAPPGPPPPPLLGRQSSRLGPGEEQQIRAAVRKFVPKPSNPLKSFNWSKLPECKVQGTIWTGIYI